MLKLIKLELKKAKLGWYVKGAITANLFIIFLVCSIGFLEELKGNLPIPEGNFTILNYDEAFIIIGALVRATFIIFAAVLISKLVIEEYRNKTISILFTYPISRKKLIGTKMLIVGLLTFMTIVISHLVVLGSFIWLNSYFRFIPEIVSENTFIEQLLSIIIFAFACAGTSLVTLYFGMRNYSVSATITSSIIVVALISSHNPAFSVASIVYVPLSLSVIGFMIVYRTIKNIEKADIA
ncbi:ABC transporter permease [Bacillus aquiflavi]|uniref:ABC transporter permease n=1 Tax=Bacillus aquiflavi TaxID=2672567 RepID=A0A6B3VW78_9BACI|nr:ABC transporter permease [Bacillus aquiflavi]MBA4538140.1 ABC transporter permease [Bacillus aquiflavi]NEY82460.1 ABC transporter permease subunit [Bacillus aquiflavi]UAC48568.1 ABC transporter permease [Bacillus aquiflavi]